MQIGAYVENKNQMFSVEILNALRQRGIDAKLSFVGFSVGNGYFEKLRKLVSFYGLQTHVQFLDKNTDKNELFSTADILLLPSYHEGLGIVAIESQAAGVRCYASDSVPGEICLGYALRLKLNDLQAWVDRIAEFEKDGLQQQRDGLERLDSSNYADQIYTMYTEAYGLRSGKC